MQLPLKSVAPVALFVGDVSWDTSLRVSRVPEPDEKQHVGELVEGPGGVVTNAAVAAARAGAAICLLVRVGADRAGQAAMEALRSERLELQEQRSDGPTCRAIALIEPGGEKRLLLHEGVSMYPSRAAVAAISLDGVGWAHTSPYSPEAAGLLAARCRAAMIPLSVDLEPATLHSGLAALAPTLAGADTVFCNARATARLEGDGVAVLFGLGVGCVVLSEGAGGATLHAGGQVRRVRAPACEVLDTTGAGDCLAGWFIVGRLNGMAPLDALDRAVTAASMSCEALGATSAYPTRAQLDKRRGIDRSAS